MPKLYVLVGVPGSGKSTWVENQDWAQNCVIVSTDRFVEDHARKSNRTYSEVFEEFMPQAVELMAKEVVTARASNQDIIWDQTSTTKSSRYKKFVMLPTYYKIAVVFPTPEPEELARRLASRPGKTIPEHVVFDMIQKFEEPSISEGFDEIWQAC